MADFKDRIKEVGASTRSYIGHFGRGILLLLGVVVIVGLVAATFFYGDERRNQVEQGEPTEQTAPSEQDQEGETAANTADNDNGAPATEGEAQDGEATPSATTSTGAENAQPTEIANTGTSENIAVIAAIIAALVVGYRQSNTALIAARTRYNA